MKDQRLIATAYVMFRNAVEHNDLALAVRLAERLVTVPQSMLDCAISDYIIGA